MKKMEMRKVVNQITPRRVPSTANGGRLVVAGLLLLAAWLARPASSQAGAACVGGMRGVDVMQVNLYVGGGTGRVMALDPTDPAYLSNLVYTVTGVFYEIMASQPAVRLQGVADEIAARRPDLVAVQEASLIRLQSPGDLIVGGTAPATNVVYDYLEILVESLAARGAHYAVVSSVEEADVEMPMLNLQTGTFDDARLTDHDAILVRTDLPPGQLRVSHPQGDHFSNVIQIPAIGLSVWRGWCSVDVFIRGEEFRFVCTHLEEETAPQIQLLQARELLAGLGKCKTPVMLAGDFNADPLHRTGTTNYDVFIAAGFKDAWAVTHPRNRAGGLTWGHDEFLADPGTAFVWRLDYIMYRGPGFVPTAATVCDLALGRTEPPLWASDHAAVSASFLIQPRPDMKCR
jgi:endonuclease/exonuclease/phosphatase family metal-dependent hydrolase